MASRPLFDRSAARQFLLQTCFAERPNSASVVCAHKVGKSALLDVCYSERSQEESTLYCHINLDLLNGEAESGELSTAIFIRFFFKRLNQQLNKWLMSREPTLARYEQELDRTSRRLNELQIAAASADQQLISVFATNAISIEKAIRRFRKMRDVLTKIEGHLAADKTKMTVALAAEMLDDLAAVEMKIVLFIDDFHRLLAERRPGSGGPAFGNDLFQFLRGANNEQTLIAIVSSHSQLMDPALHLECGCEDRSALLNQFHEHFLDPFTPADADQFLDWLGETDPVLKHDPPLDLAEKAYIRSFGGGSPYFLKTSLQSYLGHHRPATPEQREQFESEVLVPLLTPAYRELWKRSTIHERKVLSDLAADRPVRLRSPELIKLKRQGFVVPRLNAPEIFSRAFAEFVNQQDPAVSEVRPTVHFKPLYSVLPVALALAHPKLADPVVTAEIDNPTDGNIRVRVNCEIRDYSSPVNKEVDVAPRSREVVHLTVTLNKDSEHLVRTTHAPLNCWADLETVHGWEERWRQDGDGRVKLLPKDVLFYARWDAISKTLHDFSWLVAAWVSRGGTEITDLKNEARQILTETSTPTAGINPVFVWPRALYQALKRRNLVYDNDTLELHHAASDYAQRVRLPATSLAENAANCLDGSVLFASLLISAGIEPVILLVPGHAVVGWKEDAGSGIRYRFLETTLTSVSEFEEACDEGQRQYNAVRQLCEQWTKESLGNPRLPFPDPKRFAILIDVKGTWRDKGVAELS